MQWKADEYLYIYHVFSKACGSLRRQTSARTKTSACLKITLVDMTSQGLDREPPSLSSHFLLLALFVSKDWQVRNSITGIFFRSF